MQLKRFVVVASFVALCLVGFVAVALFGDRNAAPRAPVGAGPAAPAVAEAPAAAAVADVDPPPRAPTRAADALSPATTAPPRTVLPATVRVRVRVCFAGSAERVQGGDVSLVFRVSRDDARDEVQGALDRTGEVALEVPRGANLDELQVTPPDEGPGVVRYGAAWREFSGRVVEADCMIDVEVRRGGVIAGLVVDARDGHGVAGARVTIRTSHDTVQLFTDGAGRFRREGLVDAFDEVPNRLRMAIECDGYVSTRRWVSIPPDGRQEHLEIRVERGIVLAGRVTDVRGAPVRAAVELRRPDGPADGAVQMLHAHALVGTRDGARFTLPPIRPADAVELHVRGLDCGIEHVVVPARASRDDIVVRLARGTTVEVVFVESDGKPLETGRPHLLWRHPRFGWHAATLATKAGLSFHAPSGSTIELIAVAPGAEPETRRIARTRVAVSGPTMSATLRMQDERIEPHDAHVGLSDGRRCGALLDLRLVGPDGRPLDDVPVSITRDGHPFLGCRIARSGYRLAIRPGPIVLAVDPVGFRERSFAFVAIPDGEQRLDLRLVPE